MWCRKRFDIAWSDLAAGVFASLFSWDRDRPQRTAAARVVAEGASAQFLGPLTVADPRVDDDRRPERAGQRLDQRAVGDGQDEVLAVAAVLVVAGPVVVRSAEPFESKSHS